MKLLSSSTTFLMKRAFPMVWFGFLLLFLVMGTVPALKEGQYAFVLAPLLMAAFGYVLFRKLVWDLADRVEDAGDALLVHRNGRELRLPLRDVLNVSMSQFTNPPRLSLRLRQAGPLGDEIVFIPARRSLNPFKRNPVAEELIRRVDEARRA